MYITCKNAVTAGEQNQFPRVWQQNRTAWQHNSTTQQQNGNNTATTWKQHKNGHARTQDNHCATSREGVALQWFDTAGWPVYVGQFPGGGFNICILHRGVIFSILRRVLFSKRRTHSVSALLLVGKSYTSITRFYLCSGSDLNPPSCFVLPERK